MSEGGTSGCVPYADLQREVGSLHSRDDDLVCVGGVFDR